MGLFKADHEAFHRQPLDPRDQAHAAIARLRPVSKKWYGFFSRALVFGATSAALHYNVFSRLVTALVNQMLGIPRICFFDDYAYLVPKLMAEKPMAAYSSYFPLLRIILEAGKSEVAPEVAFLGLRVWFP